MADQVSTPSTVTTATISADAELLAVCAEYRDAVARIAEWNEQPVPPTGTAEALADEAHTATLCNQEHDAIIRAGTLPAHSLPGLLAKAAMVQHVTTWGAKDLSFEEGCPQLVLVLSFAADTQRLLGDAA